MSREALKWYDPNADNPPWIKALADVRHISSAEIREHSVRPTQGRFGDHLTSVERRSEKTMQPQFVNQIIKPAMNAGYDLSVSLLRGARVAM
jgi:hypothetical protein